MPNLIERIARALCEDAGHNPDEMVRVGDKTLPRWIGWRQQARVAVGVVRAPLDEMVGER